MFHQYNSILVEKVIYLTLCMDCCQAEYLYLIGTLSEGVDKQKTCYKWCFEEKLG